MRATHSIKPLLALALNSPALAFTVDTRTDEIPVTYTRGLSNTVDIAIGLPWVRLCGRDQGLLIPL